MQNVFNGVLTGAGSPWDDADVVEDAAAWVVAMFANVLPSLSDECSGSQVQIYVYDAIDDDWDEVGSDNIVSVGINTNGEMARGVAALINLKSTDPDVSGKKYIGGFTEGDLVDGLWATTLVADLIDFALDWKTPFTGTVSGATWTPGIWSPTDTVFKAAGSTIIIPNIPAYQRRRKRGIGI